MFLLLGLILAVIFYAVLKTMSNNNLANIRREHEEIALKIMARYEEIINTHLPVLYSKRSELVELDAYGAENLSKWQEEKYRFTENVLNRDPRVHGYFEEAQHSFTSRNIVAQPIESALIHRMANLAIDDMMKSYMAQLAKA